MGALLGLALTTAVGVLLRAAIIWWALPLGMLSHLLFDTLTWGGGPWLWPWWIVIPWSRPGPWAGQRGGW